MFYLVSIILIICDPTFQSRLPEHPQKSYYKTQSSYSNKYHTNTTPKSRRTSDLFAHNVLYGPVQSPFVRALQYAPLDTSVESSKDNLIKDNIMKDIRPTPTTTTTSYGMRQYSTYRVYKYYNKEHLEPRIQSVIENEKEHLKCYSPGLKVKGKPFVSRSPGHNVVYHNIQSHVVPKNKSFKHNKVQEKFKLSLEATKKGQHKITFMKSFPIIQNLQLSNSSSEPSIPLALNPIYSVKSIKTESDRGMTASKSKRQQSSASSKLHRLHLNIARVYSPGQVLQKSPVFVDTYPLPEKTEALLLPSSPLANKNTAMKPVAIAKRKTRLV